MPYRLIEVYVPDHAGERLEGAVKETEISPAWLGQLDHGPHFAKLLVDAEQSQHVLDVLQTQLAGLDDLRVAVIPVEAVLPTPEELAEAGPEEQPPESEEAKAERHARVSREELYAHVHDSARLTWVYVTTVALSTVVAAIGLERGDVAVVIGAMVIAPLLGPNIGLSFATTLGDLALVRRSLLALAVGIVVAFALASVMGFAFPMSPSAPGLAPTTYVTLGDVVLALVAGVAGALAFTTGVSAALIGVMVAVALLPPLVAVGLLIGGGHLLAAANAGVLVLVNIAAINLAAVGTFVVQGIRPRAWWEADRARRATRIAIALWGGLLALLVAALVVAGRI